MAEQKNEDEDQQCPLFIAGKCRLVLPVKKGSDGSNTTLPLHIKMGWDWAKDADIMYHLTFEGHLYCASKPIFAIAVGYLNGSHCMDSVTHITDCVKISTYKSSDGKLTFKLEATSGWHASCLNIKQLDADISYHKNAMKTIRIAGICHSKNNL
eukprot:520062_1